MFHALGELRDVIEVGAGRADLQVIIVDVSTRQIAGITIGIKNGSSRFLGDSPLRRFAPALPVPGASQGCRACANLELRAIPLASPP